MQTAQRLSFWCCIYGVALHDNYDLVTSYAGDPNKKPMPLLKCLGMPVKEVVTGLENT